MEVIQLKRERCGRYTVVHCGSPVDVPALIGKFLEPERRVTAGRGAPGVFDLDGQTLVCRQYLHGGWLRGVTGGMFLNEKRALKELEVTMYLHEKGFPVTSPFGFIVEKRPVAKKLFFLSVFLENAIDLMDYFRFAGQRERLRITKELALQLFKMGELGVYHPDMHLRNVLVTAEKKLCFLDFDKAYRKEITPADNEKMFWRLDRYVRKYSDLFGRPVNDMERLMFLRTYGRLSGRDIVSSMKDKRRNMERSSRLGWFIDRLLYGRKDIK